MRLIHNIHYHFMISLLCLSMLILTRLTVSAKHYPELEILLNKVSIMELDPNYRVGSILSRKPQTNWRHYAKEVLSSKEKYGDTLLYRHLHVMGNKYFNEDRELNWNEGMILLEQLNILGIEKKFEKPRNSDLIVVKTLGLNDQLDSSKNSLIVKALKARGLSGIDRIVIVTTLVIKPSTPSPPLLSSSSPSTKLLKDKKQQRRYLTHDAFPLHSSSNSHREQSPPPSLSSKLRNSHDFYDLKNKKKRDKLCDLLDILHSLYPQLDLNIKSSDKSDEDFYYAAHASKSNLIFDGSGFGKALAKVAITAWKNESISLSKPEGEEQNTVMANSENWGSSKEGYLSTHHQNINLDYTFPTSNTHIEWEKQNSSPHKKATVVKEKDNLEGLWGSSSSSSSSSSQTLKSIKKSVGSSSSDSDLSGDTVGDGDYHVDDDGLYADVSKVNKVGGGAKCRWSSWKHRTICT